MNNKINRRDFLRYCGIAAGAALTIPTPLLNFGEEVRPKGLLLFLEDTSVSYSVASYSPVITRSTPLYIGDIDKFGGASDYVTVRNLENNVHHYWLDRTNEKVNITIKNIDKDVLEVFLGIGLLWHKHEYMFTWGGTCKQSTLNAYIYMEHNHRFISYKNYLAYCDMTSDELLAADQIKIELTRRDNLR